ncbi:MAG: hypothetical protein AAF600_16060 [Bacteroidota bacterium]
MKKGYKLLILAITITYLQSCLFFDNQEQSYPNITKSQIKYLEVYGKIEKTISDEESIGRLVKIFADSSNYYPHENVEINKLKRELTANIIYDADTLSLWVYPTEIDNKYEIGFLDPYNPKEPNKFRKFNRFYMNEKFIEFIKNNK